MFTIYNDRDNGATSVSNLFIDEYMKDANDAQLKVYLFLLRMMSSGRSTSISRLADQFNHTEKEVLRSLKYWEKQGLIALDYDTEGNLSGIHMCEVIKPREPETDDRVISITPAISRSAVSLAERVTGELPDTADALSEIAPSVSPAAVSAAPKTASKSGGAKAVDSEAIEAFRADRQRAELLFVIEQYVGKPLSVSEIRTVYYISEDLHFSDELIDYLVQYCVDRGKKDFRYIEKVAVRWAESGITTPKQAAFQASCSRTRRPQRQTGAGSFAKFEQNSYNFAELEKDILGN